MKITYTSKVYLPQCKYKKEESMPTPACQYFYECEKCKAVLKPKEDDCSIFCSYCSIKCLPKQNEIKSPIPENKKLCGK
jgi:hypothetical protein